MNVWLDTTDGRRFEAWHPHRGCEYVVVPDLTCCTGRVHACSYERIRHHDEYRGAAVCADCGRSLGTLIVRLSTIFGLEEDEAVLRGRARVYE